MKGYGAGITAMAVIFLVVTTLIAYSPDAAFWVLFALMGLISPVIAVVGVVRWMRGASHVRKG